MFDVVFVCDWGPDMKPNFALSLSSEGLRLLHRAAGGWRLLGEIATDADNLTVELADLREKALLLEPDGLRTKLVIPNDQIRWISVETGRISHNARRKAAEIALDKATPYSVAELVFDTADDGGMTHIAAVARETLYEAEAFAALHELNPISFVAAPDDNVAFLGEPFFGQTTHVAAMLGQHEWVEPDEVAVVVVGEVALPEAPEDEVDELKVEAEEEALDASEDAGFEEHWPTTVAAVSAPIIPDPGAPAGPEPDIIAGFSSRRRKPVESAETAETSRKEPPLTTPEVDDAEEFVASDTVDTLIEEDIAPAAGFLTRRRPGPETAVPMAPPRPPARPKVAPVAPIAPQNEAERMTVFGARQGADLGASAGRPKMAGLMVGVAALVVVAGVGTGASVFLDDGVSSLFGPRADVEGEFTRAAADIEAPTPLTAPEAQEEEPVQLAAVDPSLTDEDAAVLDAVQNPRPDPIEAKPLTPEEQQARYAVTGIWSEAPETSNPAAIIPHEDVYVVTTDPVSIQQDPVALPKAESFETDMVLAAIASPAAPGTEFDLDQQGRVVATIDGALSPDGFTVFLGAPPVVPPATPTRFDTTPDVSAELREIAGFRPRARPVDLNEQTERARLGGLSLNELASYRPKLRAQSANEPENATSSEDIDQAVQLAAASVAAVEQQPAPLLTLRPSDRPRNFSRIVARANRATEPTRVAAVAPRTVTPSIPSSASVTREATVTNAINLRRVNLIGVYGTPSSRRALIRLANGRYKKVQVGDRIDGGRVSAIGDSELRYNKNGRNLVLRMPQS